MISSIGRRRDAFLGRNMGSHPDASRQERVWRKRYLIPAQIEFTGRALSQNFVILHPNLEWDFLHTRRRRHESYLKVPVLLVFRRLPFCPLLHRPWKLTRSKTINHDMTERWWGWPSVFLQHYWVTIKPAITFSKFLTTHTQNAITRLQPLRIFLRKCYRGFNL